MIALINKIPKQDQNKYLEMLITCFEHHVRVKRSSFKSKILIYTKCQFFFKNQKLDFLVNFCARNINLCLVHN